MNSTKKMKYQNYMALTPQERKMQSEYFKKNKPNMFPVILFTKSSDLPELASCKFLISLNRDMQQEAMALKYQVMKHSLGKIGAQQALFLTHNKKMLSLNMSVRDFIEKHYKDTQGDGWLHIMYDKQQTF